MSPMVDPFPLAELVAPTSMILLLGFVIALWVTRKLHWSLFVAGVKAAIFLAYYGAVFDGTFTFLDDWNYLEGGKRLLAQGIGIRNLFAHWDELISMAGGRHIVYYLYNVESLRLLGQTYYAPVALNVVLSFFAAAFMAAAARRGLGFSGTLASGLFVYMALHPDVVAWSTIMNGKDTLLLVGTALAVYVVSLAGTARYPAAVVIAVILGTVLYFTRYYTPLVLLGAFLGGMLLSSPGRRRPMLWVIIPSGLAGVLSVLGVDGLMYAYDRLREQFVNPLYGVPRMLLTPIPFHTTEHYAFLDLPQVFHWVMMPALLYGVFRIWRQATLTARFVVLYFVAMISLYGMFGELQGPRHRYQLDGLIALFQFYGSLGILKQVLPLRHRDNADQSAPPLISAQ